MTLHCHPPLTSPPPTLPICHSLTSRETCGDEMSSILLWSWCHSQALMCKTKLAVFFEKLQLLILASWTPSSKASRQVPSQFSHFLLLQLHPILQGLNFGQIFVAPIFSSPTCCFFFFYVSRLPTPCKCFLRCYYEFMNFHFMNS